MSDKQKGNGDGVRLLDEGAAEKVTKDENLKEERKWLKHLKH